MTPYKSVKWVVVLCILLSLWGCDSPPSEKSSQKAPPFTVGISATSLLPALFFIAANQHFFTAEGVEIELKDYPSGKAALRAMLNGEVDMATTADVPIVFNSFSRSDYSILATILDSGNLARVIARKDKGIATVNDLRGKKVGVTLGTTTHYYMSEVLTYSLIARNDLNITYAPPAELITKILSGELDAIVIWEPLATEVEERLAGNAITLSSNIDYTATFNLVAPKSLIAKQGPQIEKILRALLRAEQYAGTDRAGAVAAVADYLKQSPVAIDTMWDKYRFHLSLRHNLLLILESQARWVIDEQLIDGAEVIPNYLDFFAPSALQKVKPESITLISR